MAKKTATTTPAADALSEAFDALVQDLTAEREHESIIIETEETVVNNDTPAPSKSATLSALIEVSAMTTDAGEAAASTVAGYEATYASMVTGFAAALAAGNTEQDIRKALAADAKQSGAQHVGAGADAAQTLSSLAALSEKDGDLPETWVYRGAVKNGTVGLLEGEESLTSLVRAVRAPADTAVLKEAGLGGIYGKAVVTKIIADAEDKAAAVAALVAQRKMIGDAIKEAKKTPPAEKDALRLVKAAHGPLKKAVEAADARLLGDVDELRALLVEVTATVAALSSHVAIAVAPAAE